MSAHPREGSPVIDPEDPTGPGPQLREARRRANLSLEEVATQLRLDRRTLRALEENEFEHLPAPTFIRGYIRSYARLLGLPPGPILEAYNYQGFTPPAILADITQRPQARSSDLLVRLATYLVAAGLVLMVVMWWHSRESGQAIPEETDLIAGVPGESDAAAPPAAETAPAPPASEAEADSPAEEILAAADAETPAPIPAPAADERPAQAAPEPSALDGAAEEAPADAPAVVEGAESASVASLEPALAPLGEDAAEPSAAPTDVDPAHASASGAPHPIPEHRLTIRFSEDSWVEINDANGVRRVFRLVRAGNSAAADGDPPFNVLLGYAKGATVMFDGQPFDITRFIRRDTARFLIGPDGLAKAPPPPEDTPSRIERAEADLPSPAPGEPAGEN